MLKRSEDIDAKAIKLCVANIREAETSKEAIKIFIAFCERYRKNCWARKQRLARLQQPPEKNAEICRKWWAANKERLREKRRDVYRKKAEKEWRDGVRKKKPRWLE